MKNRLLQRRILTCDGCEWYDACVAPYHSTYMAKNVLIVDDNVHLRQILAMFPIVGCSAYFGSESRQEALRAGMADYLQKPISAAAIETVVEKLILSENAAA